jgi:hypothetical protein
MLLWTTLAIGLKICIDFFLACAFRHRAFRYIRLIRRDAAAITHAISGISVF